MQLKNICCPFVSWIDVRVRKNCLFFSFAIYTIKSSNSQVSISSLAIIFRAFGIVHLITWYANYCHYPFCFLLFVVDIYSSKDRDDENITIQKEQHSRIVSKNDHIKRFVRCKVWSTASLYIKSLLVMTSENQTEQNRPNYGHILGKYLFQTVFLTCLSAGKGRDLSLSAQEKFVTAFANLKIVHTGLVCIVLFFERVPRIKIRCGSSILFDIGNCNYSLKYSRI